ncbi:MAG: hypothetical protein IJ770_00985 [Alphaproteobacteria bacterium]|nr:hypothetical protein [Alphaproteobacteria bacterium]
MELINVALAYDCTLGEKLLRVSKNVHTSRKAESPFITAENLVRNNMIKGKPEEFIRQISTLSDTLKSADNMNSFTEKAQEIILTPLKPLLYLIYGIVYTGEELF